MADEQAAKETLMKSLITWLKDNQEDLRFLPDMLGKLIEKQEAKEVGDVDDSR